MILYGFHYVTREVGVDRKLGGGGGGAIFWCRPKSGEGELSPGNLISSTNKTDCYDLTEIVLKVALNTTSQTKPTVWYVFVFYFSFYRSFKTSMTN